MAGGGSNPRTANGNLRRKHRQRFRAMNAPCGICGGVIRYDQPSDAAHPLSFVIDEIVPVSRYREGGYESRRAAAEDWQNLRAAHYACNAARGNGLRKIPPPPQMIAVQDGEW